MSEHDPFGGNEELRQIVTRFYETPEYSEWTPKTDVLPLDDLREWMRSADIEILGFAHSMMSDRRFRVEPPMSTAEYVGFFQHYYERCLLEDPDGEWSDSRYSAGADLVNIFGSLWRDPRVPRQLLDDLKVWLGQVYKESDEDLRLCIVQATLEHLVEQKSIREFFSDWERDSILKIAYEEACLWPDGGGSTSLGKPPEGTF
jgi:hypothetical protein